MLTEIAEFDGIESIGRLVNQRLKPANLSSCQIFQQLDYLFFGRPQTAPATWMAGGLTVAGVSVTGSGLTLEAALWGIGGEIAEAERRAIHPAPQSVDGTLRGFGAHTDPEIAATHARAELIERHQVGRWWRGETSGILWGSARTAQALRNHGPERQTQRAPIAIEISTQHQAPVMVVASFEPNGRGFCFGAACRATPEAAVQAAARELAQAEVGLWLARDKLHSAGEARLSATDRLTLAMARHVDQDQLLASRLVGPASPGQAAQRPDVPEKLELRPLGQSSGGFHVIEACMLPGKAPTDDACSGPFPDVLLY